MKLPELENNAVYIADNGYKFKPVDGDLLILEDKKALYSATEEFSIMALASFNYKKYEEPIALTDEEKELAKHALALGIKVIVKENGSFYCSTDGDIWFGNFDSWENNSEIWFDECELPLLLKSSLAKRAKENKPLYLEDVVN